MMGVRVAVDAMGGDNAPGEIVRGSCLAAKLDPDVEIVLVGDESQIKPHMEDVGPHGKVEIVHASETVGMCEPPVQALRSKPDSSIRKAMGLVVSRDCDVFVSAGNTGAVVAAGCLFLKMLPGVSKPGICITFPSAKGPCSVTDCGANVNCRPADLYNYAVMTSIYSKEVLGIANPSVGLLSVGEEASKGNQLVLDTHGLLKDSSLNFIGNVEGRDMHLKKCDIIVCDGFMGNVMLKVSEGLAEMYLNVLSDKLSRDVFRKVPELFKVVREMSSLRDYSEYGGAPLLGVNGPVVICHGRSGAKAMLNAVNMAVTYARNNVCERIRETLSGANSN